MKRMSSQRFPKRGHNHAFCVSAALAAAEAVCERRGARLTPLRRQVLELVWASHRPIGAYELLAGLAATQRSAAPPTVYRALEFLQAHGLVHRVESRNAYIGCPSPGHADASGILICTDCGAASEINDRKLTQVIHSHAESAGFAPERQTLEVLGRCRECRAA